MTLAHFRQV